MKTKTLLFIVFQFCLLLSSVNANEKNSDNTNETFPIELGKDQDTDDQRRRSPARQIIFGKYSNGCLELHFRVNVGMVTCTVTNIDTMETVDEVFDSEAGAAFVSVPTASGPYSVVLSTDYGTYYSSYRITE